MDEDGLSIAISPVQLAAILDGQPIGSDETFANRAWGGLKLIAGTLEMVSAAALLVAPDPTLATKAGGAVLAVHGSDTASTGLWQAWTGQAQRTLTDKAASELALRLGADPSTAGTIGTAVDIAVPLAASAGLGAARLAAVRTNRLNLIEHEAEAGSRLGGHTIAKHVAKTEAELRARLLAERWVPTASSFKSLDVAERVIYQGLRANRKAIEAWAKTAAPGARTPFFYSAGEIVGQGVVRATGMLEQMKRIRIVMKMEAYKGKLYYVLTAFPEL